MKCIGTEFYSSYSGGGSSNSRVGTDKNTWFPVLKRLVLQSMPNLVEWKDAMEPTTTGMVFPWLEELTIRGCGQLTSAPCHFPSLKKLEISEICSTTFEKIGSKLTTLTSLQIWNISELAFLSEHLLQNNTSLMSMEICFCDNLVSISPHQEVKAFCSSLQSLKISYCEKLSYLPDALHTLVSLENFEVINCPNVRSFPSIQGVSSFLQRLQISCGDEVLPTGLGSCMSLQELIISNCPNLILIPDLRDLHSLTQLQISDCPNLISIPDIGDLHSLTILEIRICRKLTRLPEGLHWLTRLKFLWIGGFCEELDAFPNLSSTSIQHSHVSLEDLRLVGWTKLNSLLDEIQHFTALKTLCIWAFDGMEALPEWLGNLSCLQWLSLKQCKNLMYLPTVQAIQQLTRLRELEISNCPKLKERCEEGSGAEWSKISHIPIIVIDGYSIKYEAD